MPRIRLLAQDGWREMGSAPLDGTPFLACALCKHDLCVTTVQWEPKRHQFTLCFAGQWCEDDIFKPALWQPLPALPPFIAEP